MQLLNVHRYLIRSGIGLIISFTLLLTSCGGGGGSSTPPPPPPLIEALLFSLPTGSTYPASFANAMVIVMDSSTGTSITNASVTMNGTALTYNSALSHQEYEGNVLVGPGNPVNLVVSIGGRTYTASGTQFAASSYPTITAPAPGDSWSATNLNTVSWSGGTPPTNAAYLLGVLNATDPSGGTPYFNAFTTNPSPYSIPANSLTVGNHYVIVGISTIALITNANANSYFLFGGFNYVPVSVYTWTARAFGGTVLESAVWSGQKFVAVGLAGIIYTSPDGISFTTQAVNSNSLHGVTWSGTQFVAVGDNGTVLTSLDGINWATQNSGATLYSVAWSISQSQFVAVGTGGGIYTSSNGVAWAQQTSNTTNDLYGVTCSVANCVAVGLGSIILNSTDGGATWAAKTSGTATNGLNSVASSGSIFAAVGEGGTVFTSTDGSNWSPSTAGSNPLYSVAWTGTKFVAVGNGGVIFTSPDGVTWGPQTSGVVYNLYGITSSDTQVVAVGDGNILTSP